MRLSKPSFATRSSQWVASRTVAVVRTPPRGPPQERVVGLFLSGETFENGFESVEHWDGTVSATFGLFDDETASAGVVLASDPDDVVVPVHVTCPQPCDFGAAGCQQGGQHDVIGV